MTFAPQSSFGNTYLAPVYRNYELDDASLRSALARDYLSIASAVNFKTNGIFETIETQTGEQFFSITDIQSRKRYVFRKCFIVPAIASGATWTIPHGITVLQQFVHIYGVCSTDIVDYRSLPYASVTANANIELTITPTDVVINNGAASPNITEGVVILEYVKQ